MASEVGKGFVTIEPDTKGFSTKLAAAVQGEAAGVAKAGEEAGAKIGKGIGDGVAKSPAITAGAAKAAQGIGTGLLAAGGAVLAIGGLLAKVGDEFDSAFDTIRTGTGATGKALEDLEGSFKHVVSAVPASFEDASKAITDLNVRLGLTGKPLESLAEQFLDLSRITKTDLGANIQAATGVFNAFGVAAADQGTKLDELFRASQQTGISVTDLATQMASGGVKAREAGLNFEETAALLALLNKQGLSGSDVFPALARAMATAAKEGKSAKDVFNDTFTAIKNAPNDVVAAGVAIDVFGAKAGPQFAALIREGKLGYEDFARAIGQGDTIEQAARQTDDWKESLTVLKNQVLVALEPAATKTFNAIGRAVGAAAPAITAVANVFADVAGAVASLPTPVLVAVGAIGTLTAGLGGILIIGAKFARTIDEAFKSLSKFTDRVPGAAKAIGGLQSALTGLGAGLAIAGGVLAAVDVIDKITGASERLKKTLEDLQTAQGNNALQDYLKLLGSATTGNALNAIGKLSVNVKDFNDLLRESPGAAKNLIDQLDQMAQTNPALAGTVAALRAEYAKYINTQAQIQNQQGAVNAEIQASAESMKGAATAAVEYVTNSQGLVIGIRAVGTEAATASTSMEAWGAAAFGASGSASALSSASQDAGLNVVFAGTSAGSAIDPVATLRDNTSELEASLGRAASQAEQFSSAIDKVFGVAQSAEQANEAYAVALDAVNAQLHAVATGAKDTAQGIDINTEAGRKNRDVLGDLAKATIDQAKAMVANGASNDEAGAKILEARNRLIQQAQQFGATKQQAEQYADQLGLTPKNVNSAIALTNLEQEKARLSAWNQALKNVPDPIRSEIQALIDSGSLAAAESRLQQLTRSRQVHVSVSVNGEIPGSGVGRGGGGQAVGGDFGAGDLWMTSEKGPELRVEGVSGYTMAADKTQALFAGILDQITAANFGNGGGGEVTNLYVQNLYGTIDDQYLDKVAAGIYRRQRART